MPVRSCFFAKRQQVRVSGHGIVRFRRHDQWREVLVVSIGCLVARTVCVSIGESSSASQTLVSFPDTPAGTQALQRI